MNMLRYEIFLLFLLRNKKTSASATDDNSNSHPGCIGNKIPDTALAINDGELLEDFCKSPQCQCDQDSKYQCFLVFPSGFFPKSPVEQYHETSEEDQVNDLIGFKKVKETRHLGDHLSWEAGKNEYAHPPGNRRPVP